MIVSWKTIGFGLVLGWMCAACAGPARLHSLEGQLPAPELPTAAELDALVALVPPSVSSNAAIVAVASTREEWRLVEPLPDVLESLTRSASTPLEAELLETIGVTGFMVSHDCLARQVAHYVGGHGTLPSGRGREFMRLRCGVVEPVSHVEVFGVSPPAGDGLTPVQWMALRMLTEPLQQVAELPDGAGDQLGTDGRWFRWLTVLLGRPHVGMWSGEVNGRVVSAIVSTPVVGRFDPLDLAQPSGTVRIVWRAREAPDAAATVTWGHDGVRPCATEVEADGVTRLFTCPLLAGDAAAVVAVAVAPRQGMGRRVVSSWMVFPSNSLQDSLVVPESDIGGACSLAGRECLDELTAWINEYRSIHGAPAVAWMEAQNEVNDALLGLRWDRKLWGIRTRAASFSPDWFEIIALSGHRLAEPFVDAALTLGVDSSGGARESLAGRLAYDPWARWALLNPDMESIAVGLRRVGARSYVMVTQFDHSEPRCDEGQSTFLRQVMTMRQAMELPQLPPLNAEMQALLDAFGGSLSSGEHSVGEATELTMRLGAQIAGRTVRAGVYWSPSLHREPVPEFVAHLGRRVAFATAPYRWPDTNWQGCAVRWMSW